MVGGAGWGCCPVTDKEEVDSLEVELLSGLLDAGVGRRLRLRVWVRRAAGGAPRPEDAAAARLRGWLCAMKCR